MTADTIIESKILPPKEGIKTNERQMRRMKKTLAILTAMILVLTLMTSAMAATFVPLASGDRDSGGSTRVAGMQRRLIALGFLRDKADGRFGPKTLAALQAFQRANNLVVTGVYHAEDDGILSSASAVNANGTTGNVSTSSSSTNRSTSSSRSSNRNTTPDNTPDNTRNTPDNTRNTPDNT